MFDIKAIFILCVTTIFSILMFKLVERVFQLQQKSTQRLEVSRFTQVCSQLMMIVPLVIIVWIFTGYVEEHDRLAAWVLAGIFFFLSSAFWIVARKWYIELHDNFVVYNRGLGQDRTLYFQDIRNYYFLDILAKPHLRIQNQQGWTLDIPVSYVKQHVLMYWIDFHQKCGRFPTAIELKQHRHRNDGEYY